MSGTTHDDVPPSGRQLAYLRSLAGRTGQTFTYPRTRRDASREIRRLRWAPTSARVEQLLERIAIADAIARGPQDAARVRQDEVSGYGSTASWKERS